MTLPKFEKKSVKRHNTFENIEATLERKKGIIGRHIGEFNIICGAAKKLVW